MISSVAKNITRKFFHKDKQILPPLHCCASGFCLGPCSAELLLSLNHLPHPLLLCLLSSSHQPLLPAAWSGILSHCLSRVARRLGEHSCDTSSHPTLFACTGSTRAATQCQVCRPLSAPWELGLHARLPTQPMARA